MPGESRSRIREADTKDLNRIVDQEWAQASRLRPEVNALPNSPGPREQINHQVFALTSRAAFI